MSARLLYTIGYEKTLLKDVVSTVAAARVATLIDVRDRPISRRPGFSKRQLAAAIEEAGMRYIHLQALGTPPEGGSPAGAANGIGFGASSRRNSRARKPSSRCRRPGKSPKPRPAACCAMKPIGRSATAAGSPKCWRSATASWCPTSRLRRNDGRMT